MGEGGKGSLKPSATSAKQHSRILVSLAMAIVTEVQEGLAVGASESTAEPQSQQGAAGGASEPTPESQPQKESQAEPMTQPGVENKTPSRKKGTPRKNFGGKSLTAIRSSLSQLSVAASAALDNENRSEKETRPVLSGKSMKTVGNYYGDQLKQIREMQKKGAGGSKRRFAFKERTPVINSSSNKRLIRKGGVKRASAKVTQETEEALREFLTPIIGDIVELTMHAKEKTVKGEYVAYACRKRGSPGYFGMGPHMDRFLG